MSPESGGIQQDGTQKFSHLNHLASLPLQQSVKEILFTTARHTATKDKTKGQKFRGQNLFRNVTLY